MGENVTSDEKITILLTRLPKGESLTQREKEILVALLENKKRREIAEELNISENTVKTHTAHIYDKLSISGKEELNALTSSNSVKQE